MAPVTNSIDMCFAVGEAQEFRLLRSALLARAWVSESEYKAKSARYNALAARLTRFRINNNIPITAEK